jgi:hypothetical protein
MSKRVSTLLGWIEAQEVRCISEQAMLARRENEREKSADESSALADAARDLITTVRGVWLWLAQAGQALRRRRGRAEAGLLLVGFLASAGAVAASPSLGWAQSAAAPAVAAKEDGADRSAPADLGAVADDALPAERAEEAAEGRSAGGTDALALRPAPNVR